MFRFDWIRSLFSKATPPRVHKSRRRSVRLQLEILEDRTVPSISSLQTDDAPLHTDPQFSEPVIAFGSPSSEELNGLLNDTSTRHAAKPASPSPQENNAPNNAALAGVGSGGGGNASSTPFTPGGGNSGGGGGGGGGANWNQLLNNVVNLASNAAPTTPATTSMATASTAPATPTAGSVNHFAVVSAAPTGHGTASGSTFPGVKLLPADSGFQQLVFNTPGTFMLNVPDDVTSVSVEAWGAGGGGGGGAATTSNNSAGAGGGGGGGAYTFAGGISVVPGDSYTVTVGAAGLGGSGASSNHGWGEPGSTGGDSWFGNSTVLVQATGGAGGDGGGVLIGGGTGAGGAGGAAGSGCMSNSGGTGGQGSQLEFQTNTGGGGGGAGGPTANGNPGMDGVNGGAGGTGGGSGSGNGGAGGAITASGGDGQSLGAGGGGGAGAGNGGNGGNGEVIIYLVYADNSDTLVWNPYDGSTDAADACNWYDETQGIQGITAPGENNEVVFDPVYSDAPIEWGDPVLRGMTLRPGANNLQTIDAGVTIELTGRNRAQALSMAPNASLNLAFAAITSKFQIDAKSTITNMQLGGNSDGQFIIHAGTTTMASGGLFNEKLGVQFTIDAGAQVDFFSDNSLVLTHDDLTITVKGSMRFRNGDPDTGNGIQLISEGARFPNDYIDVDGGFVIYYGRQNITDGLTVPIRVENGGTFRLDVNTTIAKALAGTLIVQGGNAFTQNASVYLTDASSSVQLSNQDTLECDSGYYQDSGTLETTDGPLPCTLQVGAGGAGTATIDGGSVVINEASGYGQLNVTASTLNFNGALEVAIDATNQANKGLLNVTGTTNLKANSTLTVYVENGQPAPNQKWIVIDAVPPINPGNFVMPMDIIPGYNLSGGVNVPIDNTQYIVKS